MNDSTAGTMAFGKVSVPKAGDVLADQLRQRIRSGALREGQSLPTERELVAQTGLSRTSVREALRILEVEGLIEIRPGRMGGSRVRRPAGDELTRHLELFIWGRNIGFEDLHDVREALEALGAEGAARRRTDADLAELEARTEAVEAAVGDIDRYLEANIAWHLSVVRASRNELLISIINVLSNAIHEATAIEAFDSPEVREATLKIHRSILAAIRDGDPEAARRRMARHVGAARNVALAWRAAARADDDAGSGGIGATGVNTIAAGGKRAAAKRRPGAKRTTAGKEKR